MDTGEKYTGGIPPYRTAIYVLLIVFAAAMLVRPDIFRRAFSPRVAALPLDPSLAGIKLESRIPDNKMPVLLEFTSETCSVCETMRPAVLRLAKEFTGKIVFVEASVDEEYGQRLAGGYGINGVPTFFMLDKKHKPVSGFAGAISEDALRNALLDLLKK